MNLMSRIKAPDWTKLTLEEKISKVSFIQSLRETCRRDAMTIKPRKTTTKKPGVKKAKATTKKGKSKVDELSKLLKTLSPAQLESLKQSYKVE